MKESNYFRMPSIEAKDLYSSSINNIEYTLKNPDGSYHLDSFTSVFDYSLDFIELSNIHKRKREKFGFTIDDFNYSLDIINVSFNYSYNLFEKIGDIYIRRGYSYNDIKLTNNIYFKDDELVAIRVDDENNVLVDKMLIYPYFTIDEDNKYVLSRNETLKKKVELREYLYENGFDVDGIHYVRYKRSAGSSRIGNCLFINEKYYKPMMKWSVMGISDAKKNKNLVTFEAYNALSLSSLEDVFELDPKNILVVDDYESVFKENVVAIQKDKNSKSIISKEKETEITNSIWDGEGLLDESIFNSLNRKDKGMMLLRGKFFKCCAFNTKLEKWFKDNNITDVSKINGSTLAKDIKDIKLLCTRSSIKYLKFGSLEDFRLNSGSLFGIVKSDKKTHYFDGRMVKTNYQFLNTIHMSDLDASRLLSDSIEYRKLVNNNDEVLRYHIHYKKDNNDFIDEATSKNDIIYSLLGINSDFKYTSIYKNFRKTISESLKDRMKSGEILVNGTYATLFGNGYELLKYIIKDFSEQNSILKPGEVMSTRFSDNETILGARSPHITMGNLLIAKNRIKKEYLDYFNLTDEIICVNSIDDNIMQRLNGCDFDSDTMLVTNNEILVKNALKMKHYKVPVCTLSPVDDKVYTSLSEIDNLIQDNKVGEIVNLSQYLNSYLFDTSKDEIYKDICKLAVLSGMEIDKAKRIYDVSNSQVLREIRDTYLSKLKLRPLFFNGTVIENTKENKNKYLFGKFDTTMDKIYQLVTNDYSTKRSKSIPLYDLVDVSNVPKQGYYSSLANSAFEKIKITDGIVQAKWKEYKDASNDKKKIIYEDILSLYDKTNEILKNTLKNEYTIYLILKKLYEDNMSHYTWSTLYILFNDKHETFKKMMTKNKEKIKYLKETDSNDYDFKLYDYYFKKESI